MFKSLQRESRARAARERIRPVSERIAGDIEAVLTQRKIAYHPIEVLVFAECVALTVFEQSRPEDFDRAIIDLVAQRSVDGLTHEVRNVSRMQLGHDAVVDFGDDVQAFFEARFTLYRDELVRDVEDYMESPDKSGHFRGTCMAAAATIYVDRDQQVEQAMLLAGRMSSYIRGAMQSLRDL